MDSIESLIEPLKVLDWNDIDAVEAASDAALTTLSDRRDVIRAALADLPSRPDLLRLCEHYDILDKVVLYSDAESGVRVRLHIFLPGYFDRPHNHRWSYASRILRGEYRHHLFGDVELDEQIDPAHLRVLQVRRESVGASYALHHTMVHAVVAEPFTVSLVVRGPAVKDRFLVMDRKTGESWWQYGAGQESIEDAARKRMTLSQLADVRVRLNRWGLV